MDRVTHPFVARPWAVPRIRGKKVSGPRPKVTNKVRAKGNHP